MITLCILVDYLKSKKGYPLQNTANDSEFVNAEIQENLKEEFVTITTDVVEVVFSNKGGDIISYKLLKHFDKESHSYQSVLNSTGSCLYDLFMYSDFIMKSAVDGLVATGIS